MHSRRGKYASGLSQGCMVYVPIPYYNAAFSSHVCLALPCKFVSHLCILEDVRNNKRMGYRSA